MTARTGCVILYGNVIIRRICLAPGDAVAVPEREREAYSLAVDQWYTISNLTDVTHLTAVATRINSDGTWSGNVGRHHRINQLHHGDGCVDDKI